MGLGGVCGLGGDGGASGGFLGGLRWIAGGRWGCWGRDFRILVSCCCGVGVVRGDALGWGWRGEEREGMCGLR